MSKFCVFCGKPPEKKNKEHVLPLWLLRETGDPKRVVYFGVNFITKQPVQFSWSSLTMPSCTSCNDEFSSLEEEIKPIIQGLQRREGVSVKNYILLMDWMDKVRVGLWLNYSILQGIPNAVSPNFHIKDRIGRKDRYLAVYPINERNKGLNAFGVETLVFNRSPSCFGLRVNNILLVNISADFAFAERAGFPFPTNRKFIKSGEFSGAQSLSDFERQKGISHPILHPRMHKAGVELVQPILQLDAFKAAHIHSVETMQKFHGVDCVIDSYLVSRIYSPFYDGKGFLLRQMQNSTVALPDLNQIVEFNSVLGHDSQPVGELVAQIYEYQNMMFERLTPSDNLKDDKDWQISRDQNITLALDYRRRAGL